MKSSLAPVVLLALLYVGFLGYMFASTPALPDRVATHFNFAGQPDGWMTRTQHLVFMTLFGIGLPLIFVLLSFLTRILPNDVINVPRRDYWLAPQRRDETMRYLMRHCWWPACLAVVFVAGIQYLVVEANRQAPAQFSLTGILLIATGFAAGIVVWAIVMMRHFYREA
jgi:uncharacterized membrane protein